MYNFRSASYVEFKQFTGQTFMKQSVWTKRSAKTDFILFSLYFNFEEKLNVTSKKVVKWRLYFSSEIFLTFRWPSLFGVLHLLVILPICKYFGLPLHNLGPSCLEKHSKKIKLWKALIFLKCKFIFTDLWNYTYNPFR